MKTHNKKSGGKRPGAGRPKKDDKKETVNLYFPKSVIDFFGGKKEIQKFICIDIERSEYMTESFVSKKIPAYSNSNKTGVYALKCSENNLVYIGGSKNLDNRFKAHLCALIANSHPVEKLQNDYNLFGSDKFSFEILDENPKKEKFYIKKYKDNCYNRFIPIND